MVIRGATVEDTDGICETIRAVYEEYGFTWDPESYHADIHDLERYYFSLGDLFWVGELGDRVVGTVALEFFPRLPGELGTILNGRNGLPRVSGTDCSLERLYVHPAGRQRGLGSKLTETAIDESRAQGRTAMELWSDKRFEDAHRLYARFGAKVVGDRVCDDPDESPEWGLLIEL